MLFTPRAAGAARMVADLAALQLDALPAVVHDEEDLATVDVVASADRAARHERALRSAIAAPRYDDRPAYAAFVSGFFDALQLANFSGAEVVAVHARTAKSGAKNRLPKPWGVLRLALVLIRAQALRSEVGPLRLTSLHRVLRYDLAIGGVGRTGQHPACGAGDMKPLGASVRELDLALRALRGTRLQLTDDQVRAFAEFRRHTGYRDGVFSGRVGRERWGPGVKFDEGAAGRPGSFASVGGEGVYSSFVHGDLRGKHARWRG